MTTAIESPTIPVTQVDLQDLVSSKTLDTLRGIAGRPTQWNDAEKRRETIKHPTPGQQLGNKFAKFKDAARDIYGWENAAKQMGYDVAPGQADALIEQMRSELDIYPSKAEELLQGTDDRKGPGADRLACRPALEKARDSLALSVQIANRCPESFAAVAAPDIKEQVNAQQVAKAQSAAEKAVTEATKTTYQVNYKIAEPGPELVTAMAFRDTLTASQLDRYVEDVQIVRPLDQNAIAAAENMRDFFKESGYRMNTFQMGEDGIKIDLSQDQVTKLNAVAADMPQVAQLRDASVKDGLVVMLATQGKAVEGEKGVKEAVSDRMGITIKGNPDNLTVTQTRSGAELFKLEAGAVTLNRLDVEKSKAAIVVGDTYKTQMAAKATRSKATKDKEAVAVGE